MLRILGVAGAQSCFPLGLNAQLGIAQWLALLSRPAFFCFLACYDFVRREPDSQVQFVPQTVVGEMLLFLCLLPLSGAALDRPWAPLIVATDAAPQYGFGVSVAIVTPQSIMNIVGLANIQLDG